MSNELKNVQQDLHTMADFLPYQSGPLAKQSLEITNEAIKTARALQSNLDNKGPKEEMFKLRTTLNSQIESITNLVESDPALKSVQGYKDLRANADEAGLGKGSKASVRQFAKDSYVSAAFYFDSEAQMNAAKEKLKDVDGLEFGKSQNALKGMYVSIPIVDSKVDYQKIINDAGLGKLMDDKDRNNLDVASRRENLPSNDMSHTYKDVRTNEPLKTGIDLNTGTQSGAITKGDGGANFDYTKEQYPDMDPAYRTNAAKDVGKDIGFFSGDTKLPRNIYQGALNLADEFIQNAKEKNIDIKKSEFAPAAKLDGNSETLTREELASYLVATSMAEDKGISQRGTFDNELMYESELRGNGMGVFKPELIAELGKQILGDNYDKSQGTDTPESNAKYQTFVKNNNYTGVKC